MKKSLIYVCTFLCVVLVIFFTCCKDEKQTEPTVVEEPAPVKVYQPTHQESVLNLSTVKKYEYFSAPMKQTATSVAVDYDAKTPYAKPIKVKYTYANGDTYTYIIPSNFGLWKNEAGKFRVIADDECSVWLQGQTRSGQFHEFVFYGNPKFNGKKIKPNSYVNLPSGLIKYRN